MVQSCHVTFHIHFCILSPCILKTEHRKSFNRVFLCCLVLSARCLSLLPCTGVTEVCARRMWFSVMWYAGWCWAISTLVHTLLSPWRKKEKEHDRRSLGTEDRKGWEPLQEHAVVHPLSATALITPCYWVAFTSHGQTNTIKLRSEWNPNHIEG